MHDDERKRYFGDDNDIIIMPGRVVVKMDIESGEFVVIPGLIADGALCNAIDHITVEFHSRYAPINVTLHSTFAPTPNLQTEEEADAFAAHLKSMVKRSDASCRTHELADLDDESYVSDRTPSQLATPCVGDSCPRGREV